MNYQLHNSLSPIDIQPGLVLHLIPAELVQIGARCSRNSFDAIKSEHFFICVKRDMDTSIWIPTSSKFRSDRFGLMPRYKKGNPCWVQKVSYCALDQIWTIPNQWLAHDLQSDWTTPTNRNRVLLKHLPVLSQRIQLQHWGQA